VGKGIDVRGSHSVTYSCRTPVKPDSPSGRNLSRAVGTKSAAASVIAAFSLESGDEEGTTRHLLAIGSDSSNSVLALFNTEATYCNCSHTT